MPRDEREDPKQIGTRHPRVWGWGMGLGVLLLAVVLGALVLPSIDQRSTTPAERGDRFGERSDAAGTMDDSTGGEGTSGRDLGGGPVQGPAGTPLMKLNALTDSGDLSHLVGRTVRFRVEAAPLATEVAFWVGEGEGRLLVVPDRDRRSSEARQIGRPSDHPPLDGGAGGPVIVSGVVERIPYPEATYSWNLSRYDIAELSRRNVYVRAVAVTPVSGSPEAEPTAEPRD